MRLRPRKRDENLVLGALDLKVLPMEQITISIPQAAQVLSLGRSTIYEMLDSGELTKVKFGRRTLITVESIKAAVAARIANDLDDVLAA